jgi:ectoine hydroxylase-related dioxygenase (phytanoyl-CoA dioxygenase family)
MLSRQQKQAFAEEGYLVVPQCVPRPMIDAARREVADRLARDPPPAGRFGPHPLFLPVNLPEPLCRPLFGSPALAAAESLITPGRFEPPDQVQISLNIPPFRHRPGGPHVDGITPPEPSGRPGTFTMLAGILLTDQPRVDMGNLWVWPGSHRSAAAYFREQGPEAILACAPYPPVALPEPRQVLGQAGDLLLTHYLLGHNIGGNTSGVTREVVYFRLRREGHRQRWRDCVRDPLLEFEPVRAAVEAALPSPATPRGPD